MEGDIQYGTAILRSGEGDYIESGPTAFQEACF